MDAREQSLNEGGSVKMQRARVVAMCIAALGHVLGVVVTAIAMVAALGFPVDSAMLLFEGVSSGLQVGQLKVDGLTLLAVSGLVWGTLYGGARWMMREGEVVTRKGRVVRVARERGTVITETLIIIPVYLSVMLGSMQLAQNAIAGLMTTLAAFQAGRSAAVWVPETRNGVNDEVIKDKVRSAAAAVVAPVVPVNFNTRCTPANNSPTMQKMLAGMATAGHVNTPDASLAFARLSGADKYLNVAEGFDNLQMSLRGSAKLRFAYCAVDLEGDVPGGSATNGYEVVTQGGVAMVRTTITYYHQATMPVVARIFGDPKTIGERPGYYKPITRTYTTPLHLEPNPVSPLEGIF